MEPQVIPTISQGISPLYLFLTISIYFCLLLLMARWATRTKERSNEAFFQADKQSPWYLIAFGTVGGSLSGVTFVSVPGAVGAGGVNQQFAYWQLVLGMGVGYWIIAYVLLPLYYKHNLVSIYTYLHTRFGKATYKTGSSFFVISRSIGTAFRLFLTSMILHTFIFSVWGVPFWCTVLGILVLIWIYTYKGGIQTIVWTDAIQTIFMLISVFGAVFFVANALELNLGGIYAAIDDANLGKIFFFDNGWEDPNNFFKQFLAGISVALVMTGLDQDMMQKNLTCRTLADSQKNMIAFSFAVLIMNFVFLTLGALLAMYAQKTGLVVASNDQLFPTIALQHFPEFGAIIFIIGLMAAAYASTDSALTALTTSFCIDILGLQDHEKPKETVSQNIDEFGSIVPIRSSTTPRQKSDVARRSSEIALRRMVHIGFSVLIFLMILAFYQIDNKSVINSLLVIAGYTYGPLLGLYAFGIFVPERNVRDAWSPVVCIAAPMLTFLLNYYSQELFWGYKFSFELLIMNGLLTFLGLWLISNKKQ